MQKGSEYITGHYLEKVYKKKDKVHCQELAKPVYVYPAEIFCPAVPINQDQLFLNYSRVSMVRHNLIGNLFAF